MPSTLRSAAAPRRRPPGPSRTRSLRSRGGDAHHSAPADRIAPWGAVAAGHESSNRTDRPVPGLGRREGRRRSHPSGRASRGLSREGRASSYPEDADSRRDDGDSIPDVSGPSPAHRPVRHPSVTRPASALRRGPHRRAPDRVHGHRHHGHGGGRLRSASAEWRVRAATLDRAGTLDVALAPAPPHARPSTCTDPTILDRRSLHRRGGVANHREFLIVVAGHGAPERDAGWYPACGSRPASRLSSGDRPDARESERRHHGGTATPRRPNAFTTTPPCA